MSATYIDFDEALQAAGYRAKTWDHRYFTVIAPDGEEIGKTPFEYEIKEYAEEHYKQALEDAHALKKPVIEIWRFEDAPREYQALSDNGGDEDFVIVTRGKLEGYERWHILEQLQTRDLWGLMWDRYDYEDVEVWIGAHA